MKRSTYLFVAIAVLFLAGCARKIIISQDEINQRREANAVDISASYRDGKTQIIWIPSDDLEEYVIHLEGDKATQFNDGNLIPAKQMSPKLSNDAFRFFSRSQSYVYKKDYDSAMIFINRSLELFESSEALALKGSILFLKGLEPEARSYWKRATALDSTLVIPESIQTDR